MSRTARLLLLGKVLFKRAVTFTLSVGMVIGGSIVSNFAQASVKNCGQKPLERYTNMVNQKCSSPSAATDPDCTGAAACFESLKAKVRACYESAALAGKAALDATNALSDIQLGNFSAVAEGAEKVQTTTSVAGATDAATATQQGVCAGPLGQQADKMISQEIGLAGGDGINTGNNAGQTQGAAEQVAGDGAGGGLKDMLMPALIGAGLGGLLGYMMGNKGDDESSSEKEDKPPEMPAPSEEGEEESSSSSNSSSSVNVQQAGEAIESPAITEVPTVEPGDEAGGGDSEIVVAASGAIPEPDDLEDNTESEVTNPIGGTTGGTTGGVADTVGSDDSGSDTAGRDTDVSDEDEVAVVNDDVGVGLAGGRSLASPIFSFDSSSSQSLQGGEGSGVLLGTPSRLRSATKRGLATAGSSSSKGSASSGIKSSPSSSGSSSSSSSVRSSSSSSVSSATTAERKSVLQRLRDKGLIGTSKR